MNWINFIEAVSAHKKNNARIYEFATFEPASSSLGSFIFENCEIIFIAMKKAHLWVIIMPNSEACGVSLIYFNTRHCGKGQEED